MRITKKSELRLLIIYKIFITKNHNNNSITYYNTQKLFQSIIQNSNNKQHSNLLRKFHNSFFSTKRISAKFDKYLTMNIDYLLSNLILPFSYVRKCCITIHKHISFFGMFTFMYDELYFNIKCYPTISKKVNDLLYIFYIPYKLNNNVNSKIHFRFIKYHIIAFLYKYKLIISGLLIKYYFNTNNYYVREVKLISKLIKHKNIDNMDAIINDFEVNWKKINLDDYYEAEETHFGEFHIEVRVKYPDNITMPDLIIVPFYENAKYKNKGFPKHFPPKINDFKIINLI